MAGKTISTTAVKVSTIQLQTSSYGVCVPVVYGTVRLSPNVIWYGNFQAIPHTKTQGGKGLGSVTTKDTTFTYQASLILALGEGVVTSVGSVFSGKDKTTLAALGLTLFTGTAGQAPWSFLSGYSTSGNWTREAAYGYTDYSTGTAAAFVNQALGYSQTAYLAASVFQLDTNGSIPNLSFEVTRGTLDTIDGIGKDMHPIVVIRDMLASAQYGLAASPITVVDPGDYFALDFNIGREGYIRYCDAYKFLISVACTTQRPCADWIKDITDLTGAAPVWSGGVLRFIPWSETPNTFNNGNNYRGNYRPAQPVLYSLTDDDFISDGGDPITVTRTSPADAFNRYSFEFLNRANDYNVEIVSVEDQQSIEKYGLKSAPTVTAHIFCNSATAKMAAQMTMQRQLYQRNSYAFRLTARYAALEPMDVVALTDAPLGLNATPVRILSVEEADDGFNINAEDLLSGVSAAAVYPTDSGLRYAPTIQATPQSVQTPAIVELPADANSTGLALGIAVAGQAGDPIYGGCRVWLSLDGTNYKPSGTIYGTSRYGTLTAAYPIAAAGVDSVNTLSVLLASTAAQLVSASAADAAKGSTLTVIDHEFVGLSTATLTGAGTYNLTSVNRGLFATPPLAHASGATWVRVDDAVAKLTNLDPSLIGQTVHIKCTAFNAYGSGEQALSAATDYTYTITGWARAYKTPVDYATGVGGTKPPPDATRTVPQGAWTTATTYAVGDQVYTSTGGFTCIAAHAAATGNAPPNATYWKQTSASSGPTPTGVVPGSYGNASNIPTFSVDVNGRLTAAGSAPFAAPTYAPLVNGDLPGPTPIATADGQFIMVPL